MSNRQTRYFVKQPSREVRGELAAIGGSGGIIELARQRVLYEGEDHRAALEVAENLRSGELAAYMPIGEGHRVNVVRTPYADGKQGWGASFLVDVVCEAGERPSSVLATQAFRERSLGGRSLPGDLEKALEKFTPEELEYLDTLKKVRVAGEPV